jgi:hypothetical protein
MSKYLFRKEKFCKICLMLPIILSCVKTKKIARKKPKHFYFSLLVMNSEAASVAPSARSPTPLMDERMEAQPDSQAAAA